MDIIITKGKDIHRSNRCYSEELTVASVSRFVSLEKSLLSVFESLIRLSLVWSKEVGEEPIASFRICRMTAVALYACY